MSLGCLPNFRLRPQHTAALLVAGLLVALMPARAFSETLSVVVDQARILRLPNKVSTLVIGNPLIADATLQTGGIVVITGKAYGRTNFLALDQNGQVLMRKELQVEGPTDTVVVYRGTERQTYSCTPQCNPRIMLGDSSKTFSDVAAEAAMRNSQARAAAQQ